MGTPLKPLAPLLAFLALGLTLGLAACSDADSLGDAPPNVVTVGSPPTWDTGVGALMQTKCGVCHRVPPGPLSPAGIPGTFDLNYHLTSPDGVPGATAVLPQIGQGVLRGPISTARQMPLEYATPLVEAEVQALETWAANGGP